MKYNPDGFVAKFKAKIVAQRFLQVLSIDFTKTFAPTMRKKSLHIYLTFCLIFNLFIYQVNIVGTYLESLLGDNKLPIFMRLSLGIQYLRQI